MGHERRQRRREALDLGLPVGEERRRRHEQMRRLASPRAPLVQEQEAEHLDGLAEPHVVRQADAEPQRRGEREPRHAYLLIGPQRAPKVGTRIGLREPRWPAQLLQRAREPGAGLDARPALSRRERRGIVRGPRGAGEESHALEERQAALLRLTPHALPVGEHFAQPLAVQLDPSAA